MASPMAPVNEPGIKKNHAMAEEPNEAIDTKMEYFKKLIIGKFFF
jgi:hypothetical protein